MNGIVVDMALYVRQDQKRSELQERITSELQEKAKRQAEIADRPDGIDDSKYIEGTKKTTGLALVWLIVAVVAIGVVLWLVISSTQASTL